MHRILIIDDNEAIRESLRDALVAEGYRVDAVGDGASALTVAARACPAVVLLDLRMPDLAGPTVAALMAQGGCTAPIIVLSADRRGEQDARQMNAAGFLAKPFDLGVLLGMIERLTNRPTGAQPEHAPRRGSAGELLPL